MIALILVCEQAVKDQCDASRFAGVAGASAVGGLGMEDSSKIDTILNGRYAQFYLFAVHVWDVLDRGKREDDGYEHNNKIRVQLRLCCSVKWIPEPADFLPRTRFELVDFGFDAIHPILAGHGCGCNALPQHNTIAFEKRAGVRVRYTVQWYCIR